MYFADKSKQKIQYRQENKGKVVVGRDVQKTRTHVR